jgi:triosephosphate isomerase
MSYAMFPHRRKIVAGNWKMNGTISSLEQISQLPNLITKNNCEVIICPPSTLLMSAISVVKNTSIEIGSQNCHEKNSGAYTGEIAPKMLAEIGVTVGIVGHSERREYHYETNELVQRKAKALHQINLKSIICIGETEAQKKNGETIAVIKSQLSQSLPITANDQNTIIAYEPIWAIGSGETPTIGDIREVHRILRNYVAEITNDDMAAKIRIVYGGSVNTENCSEILRVENVDGALVGGASLLSSSFSTIINSSS